MTIQSGVIAVDNGGHWTKVRTASAVKQFPSYKGEHRVRNLQSKQGDHDFVVELNGEVFDCGSLAKDCELPMEMHSDTKQDLFYDLSVLISCFLYGYKKNYVITSVPIYMNNAEEKQGIKERLKKEWTLTINGETKTFTIEDVKVAPETVTAFWEDEPEGLVRWVDWGSRMIGYGTTVNDGGEMRFLDSQSNTFKQKGLQALESNDYRTLARFISGKLLAKWNQNDKVLHIGGGALNPVIIDTFKEKFPNSEKHDDPQTTLVKAMYKLGKKVYELA